MTDPGPIFTVMDAHCALCAKGASWIARNDHAEQFRIVPIQSVLGRALLIENGLHPDDPGSWLFVENGETYTALEALIRVGQRLGGVWRMLIVLRLIPRPTRNRLYHAVARRRYRWFGRADMCALPDEAVQRRLVQ